MFFLFKSAPLNLTFMTPHFSTINAKAAAGTIGIHAVLFLLFFLFRFGTPTAAPVEDLGIEVNLGTDEDGMGVAQPMDSRSAGGAQAVPAKVAGAEAEAPLAADQDAEADAPEIASSTKPAAGRPRIDVRNPRRQPQTARAIPTTRPTQQRPRYVYPGSGGGGNQAAANGPGGGEGNTQGSGDRGVLGGIPNATNYTGRPGAGTGGLSHTLIGRDISPKQFEAEFNEGGRVVIRVTVDKQGNIVSKTIKSSPSPTLSRLAMQKLTQARFNVSADAAPQQFGLITIVFKSRN